MEQSANAVSWCYVAKMYKILKILYIDFLIHFNKFAFNTDTIEYLLVEW